MRLLKTLIATFLTLALLQAATSSRFLRATAPYLPVPGAWAAPGAQGGSIPDYFDVQKEFPNYFLLPQYRGLPPEKVPATEVQRARKELEAAVAGVLRSATYPVQVDVVDSEGSPVNGLDGKPQTRLEVRPIFPYLTEVARKKMKRESASKEKTISVYASGGVIRSAIGYVYEELFLAAEKAGSELAAQEKAIRQRLERLKSPRSDSDRLDLFNVIGVMSDFDVLVHSEAPEPQGRATPTQLDKVRQSVFHKLNNSNKAAAGDPIIIGRGRDRYDPTAGIFPEPDVKLRDVQLNGAANQGGSTTDLLAMDVMAEQPHFHHPDRFPNIADQLVTGVVGYAPPEISSKSGVKPQREYHSKQAARGIRVLTDLPFVRYDIPSELQLKEEILEHFVKGDFPYDRDVYDQFYKLSRNARLAGGNNRLFRGEPGSLEEVIQMVARSSSGASLKRFVARVPLAEKKSISQDISSLLLPIEDFLSKYTDQGKLYYATSTVEDAFALLRGGLEVPQEKSRRGRGEFASSSREDAESFAGRRGGVFELQVRSDPNLRVIDWSEVHLKPEFWKISKEEQYDSDRIFTRLQRDYGVDIIIFHGAIHIQNQEAVSMPKSKADLIRALSQVQYKGRVPENTLRDLKRFQAMYQMLLQTDPESAKLLKTPEAWQSEVIQYWLLWIRDKKFDSDFELRRSFRALHALQPGFVASLDSRGFQLLLKTMREEPDFLDFVESIQTHASDSRKKFLAQEMDKLGRNLKREAELSKKIDDESEQKNPDFEKYLLELKDPNLSNALKVKIISVWSTQSSEKIRELLNATELPDVAKLRLIEGLGEEQFEVLDKLTKIRVLSLVLSNPQTLLTQKQKGSLKQFIETLTAEQKTLVANQWGDALLSGAKADAFLGANQIDRSFAFDLFRYARPELRMKFIELDEENLEWDLIDAGEKTRTRIDRMSLLEGLNRNYVQAYFKKYIIPDYKNSAIHDADKYELARAQSSFLKNDFFKIDESAATAWDKVVAEQERLDIWALGELKKIRQIRAKASKKSWKCLAVGGQAVESWSTSSIPWLTEPVPVAQPEAPKSGLLGLGLPRRRSPLSSREIESLNDCVEKFAP